MEPVYLVGMIVGVAMTGSVCYVLVQKQELDFVSLGFTTLGVLLIGMSVWTQFRIKISAEGAEINALRSQVQEAANAIDVVASELETAAAAIELNRVQFEGFTTMLLNESALPRAEFQHFAEPDTAAPQVDRERLGVVREGLGRVIRVEE